MSGSKILKTTSLEAVPFSMFTCDRSNDIFTWRIVRTHLEIWTFLGPLKESKRSRKGSVEETAQEQDDDFSRSTKSPLITSARQDTKRETHASDYQTKKP